MILVILLTLVFLAILVVFTTLIFSVIALAELTKYQDDIGKKL